MIGLLLVFIGAALIGDAEYRLNHGNSGVGPQWIMGLSIALAGLLFIPAWGFTLLESVVLVLGIASAVYLLNM